MSPAETVSPEQLTEALQVFERSFRSDVARIFRSRLRPLGFVLETGEHLLFDPAGCRFERGGPGLRDEHPELSWTRVESATLDESLRVPWGMGNLLISGCIRNAVPDERRSADFLFWALALVRQTGYFDLRSLWFLRPRAWGTVFRRRIEFFEILRSSLRSGGFLQGNIQPRHLVEKTDRSS